MDPHAAHPIVVACACLFLHARPLPMPAPAIDGWRAGSFWILPKFSPEIYLEVNDSFVAPMKTSHHDERRNWLQGPINFERGTYKRQHHSSATPTKIVGSFVGLVWAIFKFGVGRDLLQSFLNSVSVWTTWTRRCINAGGKLPSNFVETWHHQNTVKLLDDQN